MKAPFFCLQQAAKHMADGGRIVAISAAMTTVGRPNTILYAGAKAALEMFARAAAKELGPRGITVNVVSPGATKTELYLGLSTEASRSEAAKRSPFGRIGQPEDIADVVAFLSSDEARWVSGQTIVANGGAIG
jgi:3-oxoacyl-[acyl-carrier protein] reductase